ncbi:Uncharacterized protein BM_BM4991 [Brugia malayi]|uniref:MFS domain-containing protein n=2 Tax=Brugia malayi TaxID=6279 RepID=A0A4E9F8V8_BRUMA|nr:Uncharacterized protein BM_BM4991 [Brugia malayi]VIO91367.1 Uncharacterized protein BM_BM4991 [Brugia malayi]
MAMSCFSNDKAPRANSDVEASMSLPQSKSLKWLFKQNETIIQKAKSVLTRRKTKNIEQLHSISEKSDVFFLKKKRWQTAILANIGFIIAFGIRCNFGAAKGRMINNFTDPFGNNYTQQFYWSPTELGFMESAFFYGYAITQIPGGMLAAKFAPNLLFGFSILVASVLNLFLALALSAHPHTDFIVLAIQICQGLSLGLSYPAMHGVWRHWAPPMERSKLATTTFTGGYLGVMIGLPISAYLVSYIDWCAPFYFFGAAGILWFPIWFAVSASTPEKSKSISDDEKRFIIEQVGQVTSSPATLTTIPWKEILLSAPVWAIVINNFCRSWTFFLLLGNQLTYMKDVLHLEIQSGGLISSLPHALMSVVVLASGQMADYLRSTGKMSTQMVRKLFNTLGFGGEALFLCCLSLISEPSAAVTTLIFAAGCSGFGIAGFNVNHFDIAPRYAPILMGFSNGISALAGAGGFILEHLVATQGIKEGWRISFLIAAAIDLTAMIIFILFAKGELQQWAKEKEPQQSMEDIVRRLSYIMRRMSSRRRPESGVKHERLCEENEAKSGWSTRATVDNENQGMKKQDTTQLIST